MSLKSIVGGKILNEVVRSVKTSGEWKVLVVDTLAMRVISTCCKMRDIIMERIAIVEDLKKAREPLPLEAIYFISSTHNSVSLIIDDFKDSNKPKYTAAHIFFTETCPDKLFQLIGNANNLCRRLKTLKEVNIAYLPTEMQCFSLDNHGALYNLYSNNLSVIRNKRRMCMEQIAEQLATLCASLDEYPSIRYRSASQLSLDIAQALVNRMGAYKADHPSMGEGSQKYQSQLIILDRGFDLVSPLLHELTYQAMVYDMLEVKNDVYKYEVKDAGKHIVKETLLDENDELWIALRHKHIANVSTEITSRIKNFSESKRITGPGSKDTTTVKELGLLLKKVPQYQKELSKYSLHLNLAEECLRIYNENQIEKLCAVEQDLATGVDKDGKKISKNYMREILPFLLDKNVTGNNKLRITLLYAMMKMGVKDSMKNLMEHSDMSKYLGMSITKGIANLDVTIIQDSGKKKALPTRKERNEETYQQSRYVPCIKDIMENAIEGKLDKKLFPYLFTRDDEATSTKIARVIADNWCKDKSQAEIKILPRLIIFVVGGASYSETRCAYEVAQGNRGWEVLVGGTELLTPDWFLDRIISLGKFKRTGVIF